ncbi:MAG: hypothetical protein JXB03_12540 [Spirochaetales bacterium]|nr:hypothetical protein [Spirochaetales bacterium]
MKHICNILIFITSMSLFSQYYSEQEFVPVGSPVYTAVRQLYHEAGMQNFSRDLPMTVKELRMCVSRLPRSGRNEAEIERLLAELSVPAIEGIPLNLSVTLSAEVYGNINSDYTGWIDNSRRTYYPEGDESQTAGAIEIYDKVYESTDGNREYGYKDRHVPVTLSLAMPITGWLYGYVDGQAGKDPFQVGVSQDNYVNVPTAGEQVDLMAPYRAYISGGTGSAFFQLGRDRLSWGNGISGNMIMSDAPLYYDFFRFSWFSEKFKYSFITVGLETWLLDRDFIYEPDGEIRSAENIEAAKDYYTQSKFFLGHRVEFYPLKNLYLAISENTIYGGKPITWNYINPFMLYHSYYVQGYGNSFLTLETSYSPVRTLNLYGQIGVDQFQTPMEVANGWGGDKEPGAMGYIAGLSYHPRISEKRITLGYEWAYTSAYLYYGNQYDHDEPYGGNSPVLAIASRRRVNSLVSPIKVNSYVDQSIGYYTGPDSVVHYFYADFPSTLPGLTWGTEVTWLQKGERNMTTQFFVPEGRGNAAGPTGTVENKVISTLWCEYTLKNNLTVGGQADLILYRNLHHNDGDDGFDIQAGIFCSWNIL